jgi:hypothetical protein
MEPELEELIRRFEAELTTIMDTLASGELSVIDWQLQFEALIARYSAAAMMSGFGSSVLSETALRALGADVAVQFGFLDGFTLAVQDADEFSAAWRARADMYAKSIKAPYWRGKTRMIPLPAMPAEGTQCRTNCGCSWDIRTVNEEQGDYDCYWTRGKDDSCQTCIQRERDWSPLRVRGGVLL